MMKEQNHSKETWQIHFCLCPSWPS